jgi:anti-sigma-K factor RskA
MALSSNDQTSIRNYILGQLSDDEQQKTEERLMLDDELFEEFETLKGELVDEYRAGGLRQNEREWFESHFLASSEGKKMYTFAVALNCMQRPAPVPQRLTWFERFGNLLNTQRWAFAATAAAVVVVLVFGSIYISRLGTPKSDFYLTLTNNALNRGDAVLPTRVALPPSTGELKIKLMLPQSLPSTAATYRAELDDRNDRKTVSVVASDVSSVTVAIPAAQLPRGEYALTLGIINSDGTEQPVPGSYFFNID